MLPTMPYHSYITNNTNNTSNTYTYNTISKLLGAWLWICKQQNQPFTLTVQPSDQKSKSTRTTTKIYSGVYIFLFFLPWWLIYLPIDDTCRMLMFSVMQVLQLNISLQLSRTMSENKETHIAVTNIWKKRTVCSYLLDV